MNGPATARARVVVTTKSLRGMRLNAGLTRCLVYAVCAIGILATLRFTIAPPRAPVLRLSARPGVDMAAEEYALRFARTYLSWDAARPDAYAEALAPFVNSGSDPAAGQRLPISGAQSVTWADAVATRDVGRFEHVYTIAVDTTPGGLVYLSVDVVRDVSGALSLGRYPAFVGPPTSRPAANLDSGGSGDVSDPGLARTVARALRNYLARSASNLAADLTTGARVTLPANALTLSQLIRLQWRPDRTGVIATAVADDTHGSAFTLSYELDVVSAAGRWEVAAIQTDPNS